MLCASSFGSIKLGADEEEPEFGYMSWLAMLFAAGMGVGLMFFGVAEPLSHYFSPIVNGSDESKEAGAMLHTIFHWGLHAWGVYAITALALAYFAFRYKLPLSLRSCFYPLFKERINGRLGDVIDIMALVATLFGIITTLGFGAAQLTAGLEAIGIIGESTFGIQVVIVIIVMGIAILSAMSGVGKGVKILSEINIGLALLIMLCVLFAGPTLYLLGAFSENLGTYLTNFISYSFKTYTYEAEHTSWFQGWTVLYWAWWCSWSPFVGLFIARISRGRTIREFIFGVLAVPTLLCILWFTIFGNSALWLEVHGLGNNFAKLVSSPEHLLFAFLDTLPLSQISSAIALVILALFFVTSADSGIYVLNNIASRDKSLVAPRWQALLWGVLMIIVSISLMRSGGLGSLQAMTLIVALPFALLLLVMCVSLYKGLSNDKAYYSAKTTPTSVFWSGDRWKERLNQILTHNNDSDVVRFIRKTAIPAMRELEQELIQVHSLNVEIARQLNHPDKPFVEIRIKKESMRDFMYGIRLESTTVHADLVADSQLPSYQETTSYYPCSYFFDGRQGYDVQYMNKDELIADILKQYERYLSLLAHVGTEILAHEPTELAE